MNIILYLFLLFALPKMVTEAFGYDAACPNEPVTPYPDHGPVSPDATTTNTTDCPNMPIPPISDKVLNEANLTHPTTPTPKPACENQQIVTSPVKAASASSSLPSCCSGCGTNCTSSAVLTATFCGSSLIITSCGHVSCSQIATYPTTSPSLIPKPTPAPESRIVCPPGTQLVGKRCHTLYCANGSRMIGDRCITIECPQGSVWNGNTCSVLHPILQNVTFSSTITTILNQTKPDIILNNINNIYVNASMVLREDIKTKDDCSYDYGNCGPAGSLETVPRSSLKCCEVMTPRMCEQRNSRWRCYSRRSRRCGEFCVAPIIYLRPSRIYSTSKYLVMPPNKNNCTPYEKCDHLAGGYDCSGCAFRNMERCSYYCFRYTCPSRKCKFYDQEKYCNHGVGLFGCQEEDGCFDDWCL